MEQKEVSIEDYTVDRKYASHITLEEFVRRMIRSHADTEAPKADREGRKRNGGGEELKP